MTLHADTDEQVKIDRRKRLRRAGIPRPYAKLLGDSSADLHVILEMFHKGATPDQIRRIVL